LRRKYPKPARPAITMIPTPTTIANASAASIETMAGVLKFMKARFCVGHSLVRCLSPVRLHHTFQSIMPDEINSLRIFFTVVAISLILRPTKEGLEPQPFTSHANCPPQFL
jgi:hypothetical protein